MQEQLNLDFRPIPRRIPATIPMRIDPKLFRFPCGLLTALALALGSGPIHAAPAVKSRADTLAAMQIAKERGARVVAVTCGLMR